MKFKVLDSVVLKRPIPRHGLQEGDLGAVVEVYEPNAVEVEFVAPSGQTRALLSLRTDDLRSAQANDLNAARRHSSR